MSRPMVGLESPSKILSTKDHNHPCPNLEEEQIHSLICRIIDRSERLKLPLRNKSKLSNQTKCPS